MPTATDLANLDRCVHRVYLDAAGDPTEKLPASAFLELLWENGRLHEDRIVTALGAVDAKISDDKTVRIVETRRLMAEGTPLIYRGYFEKADLRGEPDLLEKVNHSSALGAFAYIPTDIKASSVHGKGKNPKPKEMFLLQLSAYAELLDDVQGWWPDTGKIIDAQGTANVLDLETYRRTYEENRLRLSRIRSSEELTFPGWKTECVNCPWKTVCIRTLEQADDVTLVGGVGESYRTKLAKIGVKTVSDLAGADPTALQTVKGIGAAFSIAWIRQAKAQKRGTPEILETWAPPDVAIEISYDIEDFTPDPFLYLHGILIRQRGAKRFGEAGFTAADWGSFEPLCATLPDDSEEGLWRRFLSKLAELDRRGDYRVYVYSHHEKTNLEKLATKYGGSVQLDHYIERFVDLLQVVRRCIVFPRDSTGLKALACFVGFQWRDEDPSGSQSMAWWAEYMDDPVRNSALRDRVIAYNEDDVRATFALRDWLEQNLKA